jgi:hypothetical protein
MNTPKNVIISGPQFGIMDPEQFQSMMSKWATKEGIDTECSCGAYTISQEAAEKFTRLRNQVRLPTGQRMEQIVYSVNKEEYLIASAASGNFHTAELQENSLRELSF